MIKNRLLILLLLLVSCNRPGNDAALYPIPTLSVDEGITGGFDLSVYKKSPESRLRVPPHGELDLRFIPGRDSLYITSRTGTNKLLKIPLTIDGEGAEILVRINPMVKHTFTFKPRPGTKSVVVMGGFNDWSRTALPLRDTDGDGVWERTVFLEPERHEYKFVVDNRELIDPENPVFVSNNIGGWNSILDLSGFRSAPAGRFVKSEWRGNKLVFDFLPPADGALPAVTLVYFNNRRLHPDVFDPRPGGGLTVNIRRLRDGLLRITGLDEKGRVISENHTLLKGGKPLNPSDHPGDWHFAVLYNLMVDRFLDGNPANTRRVSDPGVPELANFHGGDLAGVIQKLEEGYFTALGISAIWLSPLQKQPEGAYMEFIPPNRKFTGYHGYWPIAPREIDSRFGTAEELKTLVKSAHSQGIKVILDFVSNHVHEEHPYFRDHRDWFGTVTLPDGSLNIRNWSEETRLTTWFDIFLPSFDYANAPEAIDQVVNDALWWLETFDLDGFRQDAVKHVPHRFWRTLTAKMRERFPNKELYQIGETFGSDELILSYVNPGELSSQFNFAVYFNARGPFSADEADFQYLMDILRTNVDVYQPLNLMGNIVSSHDQVRFMAFADGQLTFSDNGTERAFQDPPGPVKSTASYRKLANFHALNIALAGVPVVYYGDEIGMIGAGDPDNRRPMRFADDLSRDEQELLAEIGMLNGLRGKYPSLALGDFIPITAEGAVMVFAKKYFDEAILVAFNNGKEERELSVSIPFAGEELADIVKGTSIPISGKTAAIKMAPYSYRLFLIRNQK